MTNAVAGDDERHRLGQFAPHPPKAPPPPVIK